MTVHWFALIIEDADAANAHWPDEPPFEVGQLRTVVSVDDTQELVEGIDGVIQGLTSPQRDFITVIPIDGLPDGRPWNNSSRQFDPAPPNPQNALRAEAAAASTQPQKLDVILKALGLID